MTTMIKGIAHLGIATHSIEDASRFYQLLGLPVGEQEEVEEQKVRVILIPTGTSNIELLEPTQLDSPVAQFLEKRGEGLHHVALEVDDLDQTLQDLKNQGIRLIDQHPRIGAHGTRIAFVHPKSTGGILLELCEESGKKI